MRATYNLAVLFEQRRRVDIARADQVTDDISSNRRRHAYSLLVGRRPCARHALQHPRYAIPDRQEPPRSKVDNEAQRVRVDLKALEGQRATSGQVVRAGLTVSNSARRGYLQKLIRGKVAHICFG